MPRNPSTRPPKLCRHKSTNRAYVRINGKQIFLGPWDSPKAKRRYHEILRDWAEYGGVMPEKDDITRSSGLKVGCKLLSHIDLGCLRNAWILRTA